MFLVGGQQPCSINAADPSIGLCEICRLAFCKMHLQNLQELDEEIQRKLSFLMLGSLPHVLCTGCQDLMRFLFGDRFEGVPRAVDVCATLEQVYKDLRYLRLNPNRVDHYPGVQRVLLETVVSLRNF